MKINAGVIFALFAVIHCTGAFAAPNDAAELKMVTKGVFTLQEGVSIDLTDRGILLHFSKVIGDTGEPVRSIVFTVNGRGGGWAIGSRLDLKDYPATRDVVKDLATCVLDVVSAVAPRGAAPSATFRLLCD